MALVAVGRDDLVPELVHQLRPGDQAVDPVRLDLGNGAQDHLEPVLSRQLDEPVIVIEAEGSRFRLHPAPEDPELRGVEAGIGHGPQIVLPVLLVRKRRTVIL